MKIVHGMLKTGKFGKKLYILLEYIFQITCIAWWILQAMSAPRLQ